MGLDYRVACCPDGLMTDRRHSVQVLDCSIRDGGCCNQWQFDRAFVASTYKALRASGVDWMEIGYRSSPGSFDRTRVGPWRFCDDEVLAEIAVDAGLKLAVMLDWGKATIDDLRPRSASPVSMVRLACYAADIDGAIDLLHRAQDKGYDVMCNVMAVSTCTPQVVDTFLGKLHDSTIPNVALVDSFGAFYPHHVRYLIRKYKNWLRPDQKLGVHVHNNQETAFANTIVAIEEGANLVDATILGMGRGAGNCPLELLLMYLDTPKYDVEPILELCEEYAALRDELRWGYHVPYAITGWLNAHPRAAIAQMADRERPVAEFFDELAADRPKSRFHRPIP
ncbi:MAG: aldolase catalytic domain-containing protein [Myxococcota bacterium]